MSVHRNAKLGLAGRFALVSAVEGGGQFAVGGGGVQCLAGDGSPADARPAGGRASLPGATGFAHSTVSKVLERAGISRPARAAREPANSYEWPCPGDLLHMDTSEYVRFQKPGHRVTGDRASQDRQQRAGIDFAHAIVDDHSRLAYAELHPDQRAATVAARRTTPDQPRSQPMWAGQLAALLLQQLGDPLSGRP
jgi:hypothetical protein